MQYTSHYESPLGVMLMAADDEGMTGLWFEGQKYFARLLAPAHKEMDTPILREAKRLRTCISQEGNRISRFLST